MKLPPPAKKTTDLQGKADQVLRVTFEVSEAGIVNLVHDEIVLLCDEDKAEHVKQRSLVSWWRRPTPSFRRTDESRLQNHPQLGSEIG
jgi:hypothetical protein